MLSRIRRDRSLRSLPIWAIAALVNSSVLLGMIFWQRATQGVGSIPTMSLLLTCWLGAAVYLAFGAARTRCSALDVSLPIAARSLWLSHVVAVVIGGAVVIGLSLLAVALHEWLLDERTTLETGLPTLTALLAAGLLLATLLLQAPSPSLRRIPVTRGFVLWAILVLAGVPVVLIFAARAGLAGVAVPLIIAGAVGVWLYRSVPPTFALVPLEPSAGGNTVVGDSSDRGSDDARPRMVLPLTVLGGVSGGLKEVATVPFAIAFAMVLGGGLAAIDRSGGLRELRFMYIPMMTYMLIAFVGPRLMLLHHLDALPIRRRTICAALLLPYLLLVLVGYAAGAFVGSGAEKRVEYVNMEVAEGDFWVTAPLRVYDVAWDGEPRAIESPWGESHPAKPRKLVGVSRAAAYSPYDAPPGSSKRFVALQISRAAEEVYGVAIPPGEIAERYLVAREDGTIAPSEGRLTLRADYPALRARSGPLFPALLMLAAAPWLLVTAGFFRAYRGGVGEWVRHAIFWGTMGVLLLFWIGLTIATLAGFMRPWVIRGLVEIPVMRLGETTAGTVAVWAVSLVVMVGAYLLAEAQFLRMEIPAKPTKYTLIDRMQGDD